MPVTLELGGKCPAVIAPDSVTDERTIATVAGIKVIKRGQMCVTVDYCLVPESGLKAFTDKLVAKVKAMKVGPGTEPGVTQGPMIDQNAVAKIEEHIADARAKGAEVLVGGKRHALGGLFFQPTVVSGATRDMLVAREETFGPLAPLFAFDTEAEAIEQANDTEFGLAAYFYSRDIGRVMRVAERLESGMVGVNTGLISTAEAPFGGVKQSGLGREGSKYGLDDFLEIKYVCLGGI